MKQFSNEHRNIQEESSSSSSYDTSDFERTVFVSVAAGVVGVLSTLRTIPKAADNFFLLFAMVAGDQLISDGAVDVP